MIIFAPIKLQPLNQPKRYTVTAALPYANGPLHIGHIAGVYARSDAARGVFKAPANEGVIGALDTSIPISKAHQAGLNPEGINVIRVFNGAVKIWGARTLADEATSKFRYISTRRFFNFLRE